MFTDQRERLRKIVTNALDGAVYESARTEERNQLLIQARKSDGRTVFLRFLGLDEAEAGNATANGFPEAGGELRLRSVSAARRFTLLSLLLFFFPKPPSTKMRVTIEAGDARLDVVCEDVEWWEEEGAALSGPEA